ncbi:mono-functional DNA-alkylating methyl methanesulfonate N-term-domain-containing protein [Lasiosphaeria ovina]|uniref:Mono-functional DNA-alkylating methyl methanesulfonate N-term-domain-containing protein n=1 Tax=Lasiosphaeria ovina TaxID=92902 RepID=A0AAE0K3S0_9PEZI|nr:mono-functional DNA-alkylating methyl methanesulfonate N-term-domain-containing protein [Lasiosphaeria ovina]
MAFQTNILRGGEWVTETVDLMAVLKANSNAKGSKRQRPLKPPQCGILTRTVVESSLINSILPVRIRSPQHNDVAFVGDHAVQICEFRRDGQLKDIIRKNDFGSRIRNACVIGSFDIKDDEGDEPQWPPPAVTTEDDEPMSSGFSQRRPVSQLPPQLLMVTLECGDCVFLFVRAGSGGKPEFVESRFASPRYQLIYPGFHLAVDPSSRYVALACAEDFFVVYELESLPDLNQRHMRNEPLNPVRSYRPRSVQGVIHKVDFLYPRPGDDHHIILLLIIVKNGKSRMVTYEWEVGNDLKTVFAEEKQGHRMPVENQMPVLLIPLTVRSAFIAISPSQVAVCTGGLFGPPNFEKIGMETRPATDTYHGRDQPLWTAWARPFRLSPYFKTRDCIYLAREDGIVIFIEADSESALDRSTFMDKFDCNISTAFTCLFDQYTDVLVMGSDSGPGTIWKVPARQPLELLGTIPNWAPSVDFITTDEFSTWNPDAADQGGNMVAQSRNQFRQPDRVFATSGRGKKGTVTEYRNGLRANIGLDLEYGAGVKEVWLFPSSHSGAPQDHHLLLSMPDCSIILNLSEDFAQASELEPGSTPYDLSSPTLAVSHSDHFTVQITKQSIVLLAAGRRAQFSYDEILQSSSPIFVSDGAALVNYVAIATHDDIRFQIHTFKIDVPQLSLVYDATFAVEGEITCLSLGARFTVLAGLWKDGQPFLARTQPQTVTGALEMINLTEHLSKSASNASPDELAPIEAIGSIVPVWNTILLGTRSGDVISVSDIAGSISVEGEKFGKTTADVTCTYHTNNADPTVLVSCDKNLVLLGAYDAGSSQTDPLQPRTKSRVWVVDASNLGSAPPPVDFGVAVNIPSQSSDITPILVVSGARLLLADMNHTPGPVHRHIPVDGTPIKLIYSQSLRCLIAAVNIGNKPTLKFIHPDSGEDIGQPTDRSGIPADFISGLGKSGDRIFGLTEWEYTKGDNTWRFVLVATREGRLIVVSTERGGSQEGGPLVIRYRTKFQKRYERPIYSVLGYEEGVICCVGQTIHWDVLDTVEKKLKHVKSFEVGSPATSLRISNGKLLALTSRDSLEIIDQSGLEDAVTGLSHVDPRRRNAIHLMEVAGAQPEEPLGNIILLADRDCGVGGLWVPWQVPGKDCELVFEAELPTSIRRFRRGRTRPVWEQGRHRPKYGRLVSTVDDAEILGISLDGSMQHFTLLSMDTWRFLRFIQNVALASHELFSFTCESRRGDHDTDNLEPTPSMEPLVGRGTDMQVDGDLLRRCLDKRILERLMSPPSRESRFTELLDELDDGQHTAGLAAEGDRDRYFGLAYEILDYFLQPVL